MRGLIAVNVLGLGILLIGVAVFFNGTFLYVLSFCSLILISGGLTAYLWYKPGKVYEDRGESGPDS